MNATQIYAAVEKRVQEQHGKIIGGVLCFLISSHGGNCGCEYCELTKEYTLYKQAQHRYTKRFENSYFRGMSDEIEAYRGLVSFRAKVGELKFNRDSLKQEAIAALV